ncbi:uncharacterized protein LOC118998863 [Sturnira hondurensis]|uniref:uncharacterized protein LOC118998863 n=1 Tax=Sturnira hondurensis TaxID=192404 RepID=UPI00187A7670|nr:uncharacterized protein LOC118998863 [Sturnira hondurensis]
MVLQLLSSCPAQTSTETRLLEARLPGSHLARKQTWRPGAARRGRAPVGRPGPGRVCALQVSRVAALTGSSSQARRRPRAAAGRGAAHRPTRDVAPGAQADPTRASRARVGRRDLVFTASETLSMNADSWCLTPSPRENESPLKLKPYFLPSFSFPFGHPLMTGSNPRIGASTSAWKISLALPVLSAVPKSQSILSYTDGGAGGGGLRSTSGTTWVVAIKNTLLKSSIIHTNQQQQQQPKNNPLTKVNTAAVEYNRTRYGL